MIQPNIPGINLDTFELDSNVDQSDNAHGSFLGGFSWDMVSYYGQSGMRSLVKLILVCIVLICKLS